MTVPLIVLGFFAMTLGLLFASEGTTGVALTVAACCLAIVARMGQAAEHHRALMRLADEEG